METNINKLKEIDNSKNPFKVPENYFTQFKEDIMDRLPEKEFFAPKPIPLWDRVKPWVYLAAMFIGMYVTINFIVQKNQNSLNSPQTIVSEHSSINASKGEDYWSSVQITEEEFYQYLEDQLAEDVYFDYMYNQIYLN